MGNVTPIALSEKLFLGETGKQFFIPILQKLGSDLVTFYCRKKVWESNSDITKAIEESKITIVINNEKNIEKHPYIIIESCIREQGHYFNYYHYLKQKGVKFILFNHSMTLSNRPYKHEYMICNDRHQFIRSTPYGGIFMLDEANKPRWSLTPEGGESVFAGMIFAGDHNKFKKYSKNTLKEGIEKAMGIRLNPELPLVVYYPCHCVDPDVVDSSLQKISKYANIITKPFPGMQSMAKGENIYECSDHSLATQLRYSADFLLHGFISGALASSFYLGLRVIPIHTRYTGRYFCEEKDLTTFIDAVTSPACSRISNIEIMKHISPLNIEHESLVLNRINDSLYWEKYDHHLPLIRERIFGEYSNADGMDIVKNYIEHLLVKNTFLTRGLSKLNKTVHAPLKLQQEEYQTLL